MAKKRVALRVLGAVGGFCALTYVTLAGAQASLWPLGGLWWVVAPGAICVLLWPVVALMDFGELRRRHNRRVNTADRTAGRTQELIVDNPDFLPGMLKYASSEERLAAFLPPSPAKPVLAHGLRADRMSNAKYVVTPNDTKILGYITPSGGEFLVDALVGSQKEYLGNWASLEGALGVLADANAH